MSARARIHAMLPVLDSPAEVDARERELDKHLDALVVEALVEAGVQYVDCPVCRAARPVGGECGTCAFQARMAAELAARGMTVPEFFQVGHTYTREHHGRTIAFRVDYIGTPPDSSWRVAKGWRLNEDGDWEPTDSDDFTGWTDVTEAGTR